MSTTHTYVELAVSAQAFEEIKEKLEEAGYDHVFDTDNGVLHIHMDSIALVEETD